MPSRRTLSLSAASIRPDRPWPWRSARTVMSRALTVSGAVPSRRSAKAHSSTWSQPPPGSSPRPSAASRNGALKHLATTSPPASSVAIRTWSGKSVHTRLKQAQPTGSSSMNAGQVSGISHIAPWSSGR
ncbi:hypothetical protein I3J17_00555 [Streptomyces clavuligerus]|nr:hypothetical protein I3J17_00555 [Streptomyces clavuligerus]